MHFSIEIVANDIPTTFRFEPSIVSEAEMSYRVFAERLPEAYEFRMTKGTDGQWRITKPTVPAWVLDHEHDLAKAIEDREYPQDV